MWCISLKGTGTNGLALINPTKYRTVKACMTFQRFRTIPFMCDLRGPDPVSNAINGSEASAV